MAQEVTQLPKCEERTAIASRDAVLRTCAWVLALVHELYGDAAHEHVSHGLYASVMLALARAVAEGEIGIRVAGPGRRGSSTHAALQRLQKALSDANAEAVGHALAPLEFDRGQLRSWLATAPIEMLCGVALREFVASKPLARSRCDVTPCEAVTRMAWSEAWSPARVHARIARAGTVSNWLADDENGAAPLSGLARRRLRQIMAEDDTADQRFAAARAQLQDAIVSGVVDAYSTVAVRPLAPSDFASTPWLDVLQGKFAPSLDVVLLSDAWGRASAACCAIGQVRLRAESLAKLIAPTRQATAASVKRAEENLRMRYAAWLRGEAPMPKRREWVPGDGAGIAGNKHAAGAAWTNVVTSADEYAPLRRPGRRPRIR